jgi:hypothetical protein
MLRSSDHKRALIIEGEARVGNQEVFNPIESEEDRGDCREDR